MTAEVTALLRAGIELHQSGKLADAEAAYERALKREPRSGDAWHLMARATLDRGDMQIAAMRAVKAIRLNPGVPAFHNTLGEILLAQGKSGEASACYHEALRLDPQFVPALVNLGNALQSAGDLQGASISYWKAIQSRPDCAEAFTNLGNVMRAQGCHEDALACHREALRLRPESAEALINLAAGLLHQGQCQEAEQCARQAAGLNPRLAEAHSNLSVALLNQGRFDEAEAAARQALERAPRTAHLHVNLASILLKQRRFDHAEAACRHALELHPKDSQAASNLGLILQAQDRLDEAAQSLENAVAWQPTSSEAWTNLGTVYEGLNRPEDALACFERAIAERSDFPQAHFCRSLTLLRGGRLEEGFAEYEWRWKARRETPRAQSLPAWDGAPAHGKTILLYGEQGLGDTIQFARFARLAADRGARVILECQTPLVGLAAGIEGIAQIVSTEEPLPSCDAQDALMSLPHLLKADLQSAPYLKIPQRAVDAMREALGQATSTRVGLAWAGNPHHAGDRHRSIPLETLSPLHGAPVEWFSLHKGSAAADWLRQPLSADTGVEELAALMSCMDLIVTIDSMPAHLAGALGRPVWVMLSHVADWRWQTKRQDTPWYPTMRLFRQEQAGRWEPVVEHVFATLHKNFLQGLRHDADMK